MRRLYSQSLRSYHGKLQAIDTMTRPGAGSAIDDYNYVVNSESLTQCSDRLMTMLRQEFVVVPGHYLKNTQRHGMEENWRRQIAEWSFQVVDYYKFSRETAGVAISILDRYLARTSINKNDFQCASLTALYIAIKYCQARTLKMDNFIVLAAERFLPEDVVAMEKSILDGIGWEINVSLMTAPMTFVRVMLAYLNSSSEETMQQLLQSVQYLVELASCDYFFCSHRPSDIALGSILCVLDRDGSNAIAVSNTGRSAWSAELKGRFNLDETSASVRECKHRVRRLFERVRARPGKNSGGSGDSKGDTAKLSQKSINSKSSGRQSPAPVEDSTKSKPYCSDRRKPSPTGVEEEISNTAGLVSTASLNDKDQEPPEPSPNDRPRKRSRCYG